MNARTYKLESKLQTHIGLVRDENQDCVCEAQVPLGHLYVVADGMGGHKGGRVAAELVAAGLRRYMEEAPATTPVVDAIRTAFVRVNETVFQKANSGDPAIEKMGSTAVLLLVSGAVARVAHVGDSRAYLYRNGQLKQLTKDHTMVQKMVDAGMLTAEEAAVHPDASVLERAVGSRPSVKVDISGELPIIDGDAFLLCSDGLSGYVDDAEIETILRSKAGVQEIPQELTQLALNKGGGDNITVAFVQYGTRKKVQPAKVNSREQASPAAVAMPSGIRSQTVFLLILLLAVILWVLVGNNEDETEAGAEATAPQESVSSKEKAGA